MLASGDGVGRRASVQHNNAGDAKRNSSDQGESNKVKVLGDPCQRRGLRGPLDDLPARRSAFWKPSDAVRIAPIDDHDVGRIEDTEETDTIDNLLCQHKVEVFAGSFSFRQQRPHREGHDAY